MSRIAHLNPTQRLLYVALERQRLERTQPVVRTVLVYGAALLLFAFGAGYFCAVTLPPTRGF